MNYELYKQFCEEFHLNGTNLPIRLSEKEQKEAIKSLMLLMW
jgi:hypothetical protein